MDIPRPALDIVQGNADFGLPAQATEVEASFFVQGLDVNLAPCFLPHPNPKVLILPLQPSNGVEGTEFFVGNDLG